MSVPAQPAPIVDNLEDLVLHVIDQFFSSMTCCTELVLSKRTSFEFVRPLLENHVESIQKIGGFNRTKVYQAPVEQLESYAEDLRNLEGANLVETAQLVLSKLCAKQKLFQEAAKEIAK